MAEVWEGIDLDWNPLFGNWVLKRMEFCAEDNGVRVRFVTDRGLVKELTYPTVEVREKTGEIFERDWGRVSWDDWRKLVSRIDYQKYGR